jgi:hypothetical protein
MDCAAIGTKDPIEQEVNVALDRINRNPRALIEGSLDIMPGSDVSSLAFLWHPPNRKDEGKNFIPTPYLWALFWEQRTKLANKGSL